MADSDFSVFARIQADTSNFEKGMKKAQTSANDLSKTFNNVSKIITKAISFAGLAVGTKAIADFGKSCVQSANQAIKQYNILDNTIKATGADAWTSTKKMGDMAKSLSDSTNYSVTEIEKMQSVLLGFTNITEGTFEDASNAVLDMATVMGMDLTSAVQTVGKALDDPITGLDSLRRQGFKFTDEQKAELAQLVKTGKQLEAQKIILDTLATSYGGASKAGQDSFAKQRHAVENFSDALGGKLIPLMKSFAMDNANMIDSLRESLDEIDFNEIGASIKVTFDGIKKGIQNSFEYVKTIFSETKSFMKNIDFRPIVSIINNLVLAFEKIGKINLSRVTNIIKDLKDSFSGFSENIDLTKFSKVINLIINGFVFLYEEVNKVFDTLLDNIKTFITNTWNSIKSIFEAGNKALADSETDIKSWGDYFYTIFNNLFKTVQDVIQSISYLLSGDWEIAWQYAKLVVLRIVDSVIDSMTTMITAFKDKIISILNYAQMLSPVLGISGKVIKTALSGIEALVDGVDEKSKKIKDTMTEAVKDTENKIEELTGKPADKNIKELQIFTSESKNILGEFVDNFKEAMDKAKKELDDLRGEYNATTNSMKDDGKSAYKAFSEWDSKLLKQRQNNISEYSKEYHEINLQLIEQERKKALENEKNEEERAKINEYYNNEIEEENKRSEEAKRSHVKETVSKIAGFLKSMASNAVAIFKSVVSTIKNAFSTVAGFVKNTFNTIKDIFSKLFDFNVSDALDNLLAVEDAILTFFVETLPQLPSFFESAFSSVLVLIQTLINAIDWEKVKDILSSIIDTFVNYAPEILSGIVTLFTGMVDTISTVLVENAPNIVNAVGEMFFTILEALPGLISNFIKVVGSYISEIGKYITENGERLINDFVNIVKSVIKGISDFVVNGGWRNLLSAIITIQTAIENAITENIEDIADTIVSLLPDLVDALSKSISSASKTLGKIMPVILPLIADIIEAIIDAITSDEVLESFFDAIEGIVEGLVKAIMKLLQKAVPKLVQFFTRLATNPTTLTKTIGAIIQGLVKGFQSVNWWEVVTDIFTAFVEGIKDFFGIHSPSTMFESFGEFMVQGLMIGLSTLSDVALAPFKTFAETLKSFFDNVAGILNNVTDGFKDIFTAVINQFTKAINGLYSSLQTVNTLISNITNAGLSLVTSLSKITFTALSNSLKTVSDSAKDVASLSFDGLSKLTNLSFKGVNDTLKTTAVCIVAINTSVKSLIESLVNLTNAAKEAISALDPIQQVRSVGESIYDFFSGMFATGTNSAPAGLALVGEAGPELVRFRGGEQVLNNHNTNKALAEMGGKSIVNNITFNNTKDTTAYAMMSQLRQYNRALAFNNVL